MISPLIHGESTGGGDDQLQGSPFREGYHPDLRAVVPGLSRERSPAGRADAGAWGIGRPCDDPPLGPDVYPTTRSGLPSPQTLGGAQLADGRDVHQGQGPMAVSRSGSGDERPDD